MTDGPVHDPRPHAPRYDPTSHDPAGPGVKRPRWVTVSVIAVAVFAVVFVLMHLLGGGMKGMH